MAFDSMVNCDFIGNTLNLAVACGSHYVLYRPRFRVSQMVFVAVCGLQSQS